LFLSLFKNPFSCLLFPNKFSWLKTTFSSLICVLGKSCQEQLFCVPLEISWHSSQPCRGWGGGGGGGGGLCHLKVFFSLICLVAMVVAGHWLKFR
jgi:hypothetical protein